jgi:hypothetical protein
VCILTAFRQCLRDELGLARESAVRHIHEIVGSGDADFQALVFTVGLQRFTPRSSLLPHLVAKRHHAALVGSGL